MTTNKKPYVILQLEELEMKIPLGEKNVYAGIKSFCANGKGEATLSIRDIAKRSGTSKSTVSRNIPGLLKKGLVEITGEGTGVGGRSPTYKIKCPEMGQLRVKECPEMGQLKNKVSRFDAKVSHPQAQNRYKVKRNNIESPLSALTTKQLAQISSDLNVPLASVKRKHETILDKIKAGEFHNKSVFFTLRNWLRGDLERGYLQEMDEINRMAFLAQYRKFLK